MVALGGAVVTVEADGDGVEAAVALGCAGVSGVLGGAGSGGVVLGAGRFAARMWGVDHCRGGRGVPVAGRRMCCCRCWLLVRRADTAAVIGSASGGESGRGRASADRGGAGPPGGDGAGLVAPFRRDGSRRCGRCSPGGAGPRRRIRCCLGRPGRRLGGRPRGDPAAAAAVGARFGSATVAAGRSPPRCRRARLLPRAGPSATRPGLINTS